MQSNSKLHSAWNKYWDSGRSESCSPGDRDAGYMDSLDSTWKEFFAGFPDGARLVDLATGGAYVVRIAIALGRDFDITGVDLADLSAVSAGLQVPGVRLVGNTDLSNLPFPDGAFDGVTSQFGIEYADIAVAVREAVRVLAPGGRGRLVLHHSTGAVTLSSARRLAAYRSVFSNGSAFQSGRLAYELRQRGAPAESVAQADAAFQAALGELQRRLRPEPPFGIARTFATSLTSLAIAPDSHAPAKALEQIDEIEGGAQAFVLRTQAQIDSALDRQGAIKVAEWIADAGAIVDPPQELKIAQTEALAWGLSFRK